jgi:hypothetical protein
MIHLDIILKRHPQNPIIIAADIPSGHAVFNLGQCVYKEKTQNKKRKRDV